MREPGDVRGVAPGDYLGDGVRAGDEVELDVRRVEPPEQPQRVSGVGDPVTVDLEARGDEVGVVGRREQRHREALLARGDVLVQLERRPAGRHEHHEVEVEVVEGLLSGDEMSVVYGVEGPAHDAEAVCAPLVRAEDGQVGGAQRGDVDAHRTCPSPRARYFVVVRAAAPMGPRAWSFCVEIPISPPSPKTPPSVKRVEAFA